MIKRFLIICAALLSLSLLAGCMPAVLVASSTEDEELREDRDWETVWDEFGEVRDSGEKDHYWKILDVSDPEGAVTEAGTVTEEEQVKALDDLLSGDDWDDLEEEPGAPAYSYVFCQLETLKAGQDPEDREYEELLRFTVSAEKDAATLKILLPSLLGVDAGDLLTFTCSVPAETAEALRTPGRFLE